MPAVNRRGPVPVYQQIADNIAAGIAAGTWPSGERIPSEPELMRTFGVAQLTARKAVRVLVAAGLVHVVRGKGAFVTGQEDQEFIHGWNAAARANRRRAGEEAAGS